MTRKGTPDTETRLYAAYGSYDTYDARAGVSGSVQDLGFHLNAGYYDTEGYRDNSELMKKDLTGVFDYFLTDVITLNLSGAFHEDEYGLPGPVGKQDIDSRKDRTETDYPEDGGTTIDKRIAGGFDIETDHWGSLKLVRGYRWRDNQYIVGYSPLLTKSDQTDEIEENSNTLTLIYDKSYSLFERTHIVSARYGPLFHGLCTRGDARWPTAEQPDDLAGFFCQQPLVFVRKGKLSMGLQGESGGRKIPHR